MGVASPFLRGVERAIGSLVGRLVVLAREQGAAERIGPAPAEQPYGDRNCEAEAERGERYLGTVVKVMNFGAFVSLLPGKDGLLHISQIAHERVEKVTDYLQEGQIVKVKALEADDKGRIKLSMKALLERPAGMPEREPREPREYRERAPRQPRENREYREPREPREPRAEQVDQSEQG